MDYTFISQNSEDLKEKEMPENNEILLDFLKKTKDGEYAPIDDSSLNYSRLKFETNNVEVEEEQIYYSLS